jgi:diaminopimelate epimerase
MELHKYQALGNDYFVLDAEVTADLPSPELQKTLCHRNFGFGSDGILFGPLPSSVADFRLRILNPDASEAEKSGNGLRIFARYLLDTGRVKAGLPFSVETLGGCVECQIDPSTGLITVDMGRVSFDAATIPVEGHSGEVLEAPIELKGLEYRFAAATIGNPHCVLPLKAISKALACELGPLLETHPFFPNRTNVQLLKVIDRSTIQIEIWERGAGYTLASGSSSSAAGAVARRLGLVDAAITVRMPGGTIDLLISEDYSVRMTGPAEPIGTCRPVTGD